jgi:hypothetical protein
MTPFFQIVTDLRLGVDILRRRRHGVIEVVDGQFRRVLLRPYPAVVSLPYVVLVGQWSHRHTGGDRCLLYYSQPRRFPNFLTLRYLASTRGSSPASLRRVLEALDEIARLKQSDALLADVANWRISARLLARLGWAPHCGSRWHRHYIKRFYGNYPPRPRWLEPLCLARPFAADADPAQVPGLTVNAEL